MHEIASKLGKLEDSFMDSLQSPTQRAEEISHEPLKAQWKKVTDDAKMEIKEASQFCIDWYNLLIELANKVFWIEFSLR